MPNVAIERRPGSGFNDKYVMGVAAAIRPIVASALNVEINRNARLIPIDIEVRVRDGSNLDLGTPELAIIIVANTYPERSANKDVRRAHIRSELLKQFPGLEGRSYVWLQLVDGSFAKF